jgi:hypothetical protein
MIPVPFIVEIASFYLSGIREKPKTFTFLFGEVLQKTNYTNYNPGLNAGLHRPGGRHAESADRRLHLTHLEPFVATDLLAHSRGTFIRKQVCRAPASGHLQRYLELTPGCAGVLTNTAGGDSAPAWGCGSLQYHLAAVPGTNLFLGLIEQQPACSNSSSGASSAFCWCSTLDRTCLDCQHWEQGECECPCECETREEFCIAQGNHDDEDDEEHQEVLPCQELFGEAGPAPPRFLTARTDHLPPCIHTDCAARPSEADCFGVLGCAWCATEPDGVTALGRPFCANQVQLD